ncbi:hypothetical protein, partial [Streptomyces niveiscabiei]|uniref:hypothetical protein n=1 Tax=Streptomyces niveiscabiei TaxID=164115 RepID=UPI001980C71E
MTAVWAMAGESVGIWPVAVGSGDIGTGGRSAVSAKADGTTGIGPVAVTPGIWAVAEAGGRAA